MTECYKLLFDLSLYYTVSGFYLSLAFGEKPVPLGFLLLAAAVLADTALRNAKRPYKRAVILPLLLPLFTLLARPGLWQIVQLLPGWVYLGWSLISGRTDTDYLEFQGHFSFGLKLLLLFLTGIPFWKRLPDALSTALPYLILMLADGVCLLRMLRERQKKGLLQTAYIAVFLALCAGLTLGRAPQLLLSGFSLLYQKVLAPLLFCIAVLCALVCGLVFLILKFLISLRNGEAAMPELQLSGIAEDLGIQGEYEAYLSDLSWMKTLLIVVAAAFAVLVLVLIFLRLMGSRHKSEAESGVRIQSERVLRPNGEKRSFGRIRPRDPRLAVRYYYAKYLAECRNRGLEFRRGMTAAELCEHSRRLFPDVDPMKLEQVYAPARYSSREAVTRADADAAAALWKELKQSKTKDA